MFRFLLTLLVFLAFVWTAGLVAFVHAIPEHSPEPMAVTDTIVVLTGGELRVDYGFRLLSQGKARSLFISGVGAGVTVRDLLVNYALPSMRKQVAENPQIVTLDYAASDTHSNAGETQKFMRLRGYRSMRLVTAGYHMPRSLLEFRLLMPDVTIVPDPVTPPNFRRDQWWRHDTTRRLLLSEYHKTWAVRMRALWMRGQE
jgi:uncharacterized SAM-binding protein YcdF (DUF218 family)